MCVSFSPNSDISKSSISEDLVPSGRIIYQVFDDSLVATLILEEPGSTATLVYKGEGHIPMGIIRIGAYCLVYTVVAPHRVN